jgi:hypothetical protein
MADKLTIRIKVDDTTNQTVSRFAVDEKGQVTIYNDASAGLKVEFDDASPLCQGNTPKNPIEIDAGKDDKFQVCNDSGGLEFKYTATVDGAAEEDPILIIERAGSGGGNVTNPIVWVEMVLPVLAGLLAGVVAGYLIAMRRRMRSQ